MYTYKVILIHVFFVYQDNRMKNTTNKYHTVGIFPIFNRKKVQRGKIDITNTQIRDRPLTFVSHYRPFNKTYNVYPSMLCITLFE
jgi:hypothetical protein